MIFIVIIILGLLLFFVLGTDSFIRNAKKDSRRRRQERLKNNEPLKGYEKCSPQYQAYMRGQIAAGKAKPKTKTQEQEEKEIELKKLKELEEQKRIFDEYKPKKLTKAEKRRNQEIERKRRAKEKEKREKRRAEVKEKGVNNPRFNLFKKEEFSLHMERLDRFGKSRWGNEMYYKGSKGGIYTVNNKGTRNYKY